MHALTPTIDELPAAEVHAASAAKLDPPAEIRSLSVVIPLLNESESLPTLYRELTGELGALGLPYEIIFVDDGSTDGSAGVLRALHAADDHLQVIQFRRNFGKSSALQAGFSATRGDAVVTLDADLQDVPAEIPRLLAELDHGADLVSGWKVPRQDPTSKRLASSVFNAVVRLFTGVHLHDFNCGLKVYRAEVLDELRLYGELHRYVPVLAHFRGFQVVEVPVSHRPRRYGRSKFGPGRFARGFFDLLTVLFLTQYTRRPLHFFGWFGLSTLAAGFTINAYLAILWFMGRPIGQRPLLTLGVLLMIVGAQFVSFGLLGEMIASGSSQQEFSVRRHLGRHHPLANGRGPDLSE
ncbi:MAG TPA: glycosyltransferase family 2 protein [Thermomicrobiaceae bacterium]|nr:glycosyltransferase family 2 protein [Thermomicrobiaceae bacterium]